MTNLEVLDVSKNRLSSLPGSIGKIKTLKQLFLAHNKLFYRPLTPELGKLNRFAIEKLVCVFVVYCVCFLYCFSLCIVFCLCIVYVCFFSTTIHTLTNFCSLLRLDLSNNQLDELPAAISQLSTLQYLDLSNNALKALLPEYGKLESLTHVNVSHNQITSLPVRTT